MIDRITKSSLNDFKSKFSLDANITESELFEHFINYTVLERKLENRIDEDSLLDINIGKNGTIGIDGFCLLINKQLVTSIDELSDILISSTKPEAEVHFIQSKTSNEFNIKEISSFGNAVEDFVSLEQKYNWSRNSLEFIKLFKYLIDNASKLAKNPACYMYYCTLGDNQHDHNTEAEKKRILQQIKSQKVFSSVSFQYLDHGEIHNYYKKIGQKYRVNLHFH